MSGGRDSYNQENYPNQSTSGSSMRDIILNTHDQCYIQDNNTGTIKVLVGPRKVTLQPTDQTVTYNTKTRVFDRCKDLSDAKKKFPYADETSYLILENPSADNEYPKEGGENDSAHLHYGKAINLAGPATFALWPGQSATVVKGHRLRSNQYLLVRVINDKTARENIKETVAQNIEGDVNANSLKNFKLTTGALNIIKGTDVSFYIPPTGIEVVPDEKGNYVREALTLERLRYCILVDENGKKRYMPGPAVVFPEPTEQFVSKADGSLIYTAIELNDNMGIYVKTVDEYEEKEETHEVGKELFITGKEQKIYFPRVEHEIIKYGGKVIHYATTIPKGEGLYVLDKNNGEVETKVGPKMFLPNPIGQIIVKRVLEEKQVNLWFPGNAEAKTYNETLRQERTKSFSKRKSYTDYETMALQADISNVDIDGGLDRPTSYTKPRTIKLDTKYTGAVVINVWPGYAVQIVGKTGNREVIVGPKAVILDYDQVLEVLTMSTGRPKNDKHTEKTVYLKVKNNTVTDEIKAKTKNLVDVRISLSYKVNFEGDHSTWFDVENYVKLLTDNCRSIIRNLVKKHGVEEFNENAEDILRNIILGESSAEGRKGKIFEENGMRVYDLDILGVVIGDDYIDRMIIDSQHKAVKTALELKNMEDELREIEAKNDLEKSTIESNEEAEIKRDEKRRKDLERKSIISKMENTARLEEQDALNHIITEELGRKKLVQELEAAIRKEAMELEISAFTKKFEAINPQLVQAIVSLGDKQLAKSLVEHLPEATGTSGFLFGKGGTEGLLSLVGGSKLEETIKRSLVEANGGNE